MNESRAKSELIVTSDHTSCLIVSERPRKIGAKFTGASFAPDEFSQPELKHDYEGKRDRWNGYNNEEYTVTSPAL